MTLTRHRSAEVPPSTPFPAWLTAPFAIVAIAAVALGAWALWGGTDEVDLATARIDEFSRALNDADAAAIEGLFTGAGIYADPLGQEVTGPGRIGDFIENLFGVSDVERIGEGREVADGVYLFTLDLRVDGDMWTGDLEVELDGDLLSRMEWLRWVEK